MARPVGDRQRGWRLAEPAEKLLAHLGPGGGGLDTLRRECEEREGDDEHRQTVPNLGVGPVDCASVTGLSVATQ